MRPRPPDTAALKLIETERRVETGRLVEIAHVGIPFGVKGWVKVYPLISGGETRLGNYRTWFLAEKASANASAESTGWREVAVEASEVHGDHVVARLAGVDDRDAAVLLKGRVIAVPREAFAPAAEGEYYWADLIGLAVRNAEGQDFGAVTAMMETGANDVMVVRQAVTEQAVAGQASKEVERLIPFLSTVIRRVDVAAGVIEVDWGVDY